MKKNIIDVLKVVQSRLLEVNVLATLNIVREGTPGEYPELLIEDIKTVQSLSHLWDAVHGDAIDVELHIEVSSLAKGYTPKGGKREIIPIYVIRPRISYLLESERMTLKTAY